MGLPPYLFLHPFEAWRADIVFRTKGHIIPIEMPDDFFGRIQTQRWKVWLALDIPLGINLPLVHLVLVFVVHVTIHCMQIHGEMRFNFMSFQLNRTATDLCRTQVPHLLYRGKPLRPRYNGCRHSLPR